MKTGINRRIALPLIAAVLAFGVAGCIEDDDLILPARTDTQRFFQRYVAMGNSITAGYMSGGINDSTQHLAYPVLLAEMAGVSFGVPSLAMPGCPPPLVGVVDVDAGGNVVLETDRVGGPAAQECSLRGGTAPDIVQNVAIPGAKIADAVDIQRAGNATNTLTTLITGGESQVEAMQRAQPTLVTAWLGNNDVLNAALRGDTSLLTPIDTFEFYANRMATGIANSGTAAAALIGVIDVRLAPVLQPGLYFWVADSLGLAPKPADANCGPTDEAGAPNSMAMNTVSWLVYSDPNVAVVSCDPSAPYVLTAAEEIEIGDRIAAFNNILQAEVRENGWLYVNATGKLEDALAGTGREDKLRQCSGLSNTLTPTALVATFITECPHPDAPNYFGSLVTYDGVHLSAAAHRVMADGIAEQLNATYGLDL